MEKFFLHIWHQTIRGLSKGSAGPDIKERVQPISAENSSLIGIPRWGARLSFFCFLDLLGPWSLFSLGFTCSSNRVASWLLTPLSSTSSVCRTVGGTLVEEVGLFESPRDQSHLSGAVALAIKGRSTHAI